MNQSINEAFYKFLIFYTQELSLEEFEEIDKNQKEITRDMLDNSIVVSRYKSIENKDNVDLVFIVLLSKDIKRYFIIKNIIGYNLSIPGYSWHNFGYYNES